MTASEFGYFIFKHIGVLVMVVFEVVLVMAIIAALAIIRLNILIELSGPDTLDYNKRWTDDNYVKMIHNTRSLEKSLEIELTPCGCSAHNLPKAPVGPAPGAVLTPNESRTVVITGNTIQAGTIMPVIGKFAEQNNMMDDPVENVLSAMQHKYFGWTEEKPVQEYTGEYLVTHCLDCGQRMAYSGERPVRCVSCLKQNGGASRIGTVRGYK